MILPIKKYTCQKCNHTFSETSPPNFVKSVIPPCPICASNDIQNINYVEKKKKK